MILEVAILDVIPQQEKELEAAFEKASPIISSMSGYVSHQLQRCVEKQSRYILLVNWEKLEDHTVGFRGSEGYRSGENSCITFTIHFRRLSTMS